MDNIFSSHSYSLCASGIAFREHDFPTRESAMSYMYKFCGKKGLRITEVWEDNHDKTYLCGNSIKFYISRLS